MRTNKTLSKKEPKEVKKSPKENDKDLIQNQIDEIEKLKNTIKVLSDEKDAIKELNHKLIEDYKSQSTVIDELNSKIEQFDKKSIKLSKENDKLLNELEVVKTDDNNDDTKNNLIKLFNELQDNYIKMGSSSHEYKMTIPRGTPNFKIIMPNFLNRLITYFPFLSEVKKY